MGKRVILIAVAVLLLLGLIAFSQFRSEPRKVSGFIEADEIRLGSRVGGRVAAVLVEEGQRVSVGEDLIRLEPFDILEQEREAQAALAARAAEYSRLVSGFRDEEKAQVQARVEQFQERHKLLQAGARPQEIEAAQGRLRLANAELLLAQQNHDRSADLFQQNVIARSDMDRAVEELHAAQAMLDVRTKELELLKAGSRPEEIAEAAARLKEAEEALALTRSGYRSEEIEQAKAARDAAQAALDAIRRRKEELTIRSPVPGVIEALELQPGDLVAASAPVLSILDERRLWVRAYVPENRLGITVGQKLWVTVDSFPRARFAAEVTFIARQAEFTPSNVQTPEERSKQVFRIKVTLQEGHDRLHPGMAADVWLTP